MKITFLIGNGFDVSMGIESSYSKFYEWYCNQPSVLKYINDFKANIQKDMRSDVPDEEKTWADFELGLGKYTAEFTPNRAFQFLDCYEDAQGGIVQYLKEQEAKCNVGAVSDDSLGIFADSILNFYQELSDLEKIAVNAVCNGVQNENREISFISFNYTGILGEILKRLPSTILKKWRNGSYEHTCTLNPNIIHVHGTITEFPIIGVDADGQIVNQELLATPQFREIMIKAECVNALGRLWHRQAEELISQSRIVCVFGMSLGETDAKWWRKLAQWLKADGNRHVVIYWYDRNPPNGVSIRKQLEGKNRVIEKLLSYSSLTDTEKNTVKSRIHVIINTNKFLKIPRAEITKENPEEIASVKDGVLV